MFAINFAGHDTTANTLAFAMLMLAAYPEVQDWIGEEAREYMGDKPIEDLEYGKVYPKLKRSVAVMHETLRLFPPVLALPKYSPKIPHALELSDGRILTIPPGATVIPSVLAVQMLPEFWGADAREWKPKRWINSKDNATTDLAGIGLSSAQLSKEELLIPKKGTFFPWSEGVQNCPAQKFSLVEIASVMAILFRNHRMSPRLNAGETSNDARKRLLRIADDCDGSLLLRVRDADSTRLVWRRV